MAWLLEAAYKPVKGFLSLPKFAITNILSLNLCFSAPCWVNFGLRSFHLLIRQSSPRHVDLRPAHSTTPVDHNPNPRISVIPADLQDLPKISNHI